MKGKLTIAEVNCDDHAAVCEKQNIAGYPSMVFFIGGSKTEYMGSRKLDQMRAFAEKASAPYVKIVLLASFYLNWLAQERPGTSRRKIGKAS